MSYLPDYAILNREELIKLQDASGRTILIYTALVAYGCKDRFCFPSHDTIRKYLDLEMPDSTISRCLATLEKLGLIKRGNQRSKRRYELLYRRAVQAAKGLVSVGKAFYEKSKAAIGELGKTEKPRLAKQKTYNKRKTQHSYRKRKKNLVSIQAHGETVSEIKAKRERNPANHAFGRVIVDYPNLTHETLSSEQRSVLHNALEGRTHERDWYDWVLVAHGDKIAKIKDYCSI